MALASIDLPASLTSIGSYAFDADYVLTSGIVIPKGVASLPIRCFRGCTSLTSVQLPDSFTDIGAMCFYQCSSLSTVNFPSGLMTVGSSAFTGCALTIIDLPDTITYLYNGAFNNCPGLIQATVRSGVLGSSAFSSCPLLTKVTLGEGVTSIGSTAFHNDTALKSVSIPASVAKISYQVFGNCESLTDLTVEEDNSAYCVEGNVLYTKDKKKLVACLPMVSGAFTAPDTVTDIDGGFYTCGKLTSITLPEGLTNVGTSTFNNCSQLARVVFRSACPSFSTYNPCFANCPSSLVAYFPVKHTDTWASYSLTNKQAYANATWELGDGSAASTTTENINAGLIAAPADPVRDGYTFADWYDDASDTASKWDFAVSTVIDDLTLYAHWTAIPYTITFDSKGGSVVDTITADYGATLTAPADPAREGYTFLGWDLVFPVHDARGRRDADGEVDHIPVHDYTRF